MATLKLQWGVFEDDHRVSDASTDLDEVNEVKLALSMDGFADRIEALSIRPLCPAHLDNPLDDCFECRYA